MDDKDNLTRRGPDLHLSRAKEYLDKAWAEAGEPPSDDALYERWKAGLESAGALDRALEEVQAALKLDPGYAEAYYSLGVIQLERGDLAAAEAAFDKCIEMVPGDAEAYYQRAMVRRESGDAAGALADLERSAALDPEAHETYWGLASVRNDLGRRDEALDDISRAVSLDPDNADYRAKKARLLLDAAAAGIEEALDDALKCLEEGIAAAPERAELYFLRSEVYCRRADLDAELADLNLAINLEPSYAEAYLRRYDCCLERGDRSGAAADWLAYSALAPEDSFLITAAEAREALRRAPAGTRLN